MKKPLWQAFSLLYRYPAFGRLWVGSLVSLFGDAFTLIALPWFVLQITNSGTATAGILLTLQLPAIVTSMVIGPLIDRFQPRAILTIDNSVRALIIGLIPILYWLGLLKLWLLFLLTGLAGMLAPVIALLWGATLLPLVFINNLWLACSMLLLGGLMWGPYTPMETTLLQRTVPKSQLGRVFGARSALLTGGSPLGLAIGGLMLAFIPSTSVIALSAAACILVGIGGLTLPAFRTIPRFNNRIHSDLWSEPPVKE
ncbi:MAG: MFS transporter [Chloroflexi bacterium]|nr:MFS transporter [Chloroflexota bacterium]MCI0580217.1 MFS transporter [Chloroflexota bacterium]MCI0646932.1 MFS transporter [Chloroflexota bacterium]MCI0728687.1 MFS transporter [Chloroflexota bacterium]